MTVKAFIAGSLKNFQLSESDINFILDLEGLNGDDTYNDANAVQVKTAVYKQVPRLIAGLTDVSEGGYSVKYNLQAIKEWFAIWCEDLGLPNPLTAQPKIKNLTNRW